MPVRTYLQPALTVLREYREDLNRGLFYAVHDDEERAIVDALVVWGDGILGGAYRDVRNVSFCASDHTTLWDDQYAWQCWLRALAGVLPGMWD